MPVIILQIGFSRGFKEGQLLNAYINDEQVSWRDDSELNIVYLTALSDRNKRIWVLKSVECQDGDLIRIEIKIGLRGKGADENRTGELLFRVDGSVPVQEVILGKTGFKGYPLLKGSVVEMGRIFKTDERLMEADMMLQEVFDGN